MSERTLIYKRADIENKLKRLAYQILEDHHQESEIYLLGILPAGNILSKILKKNIQQIKAMDVFEYSIEIDKKNPLKNDIKLSFEIESLKNKCVILLDDVVNTGKTTFYSMQPLTNIKLKSLKVAVLVDRLHKKFPIHCDYVGISLSTTMQKHIEVEFDKNNVEGIYLC